MKFAFALMIFSTLATPLRMSAQTAEPDQAPPVEAPTSSPLQIPAPAPAVDRPVSWKLLLPNVIADQQRIFSFPARLAHGKDWIPTSVVLGTTAGLVALDPTEAAYFHRTATFHNFNNVFSSNVTSIGTLAAPASLYVAGLIRKDAKMQRTALLAAEAFADAEILTTVLKNATRRVRPAGVPTGGNYSDTWFESRGSILSGHGAFPSGHTIAAFSVATVIARRYGNHRWVPYVAYGAAALVGFSRLSLSSHFASDVFVGGALGYTIGRFAVLR